MVLSAYPTVSVKDLGLQVFKVVGIDEMPLVHA